MGGYRRRLPRSPGDHSFPDMAGCVAIRGQSVEEGDACLTAKPGVSRCWSSFRGVGPEQGVGLRWIPTQPMGAPVATRVHGGLWVEGCGLCPRGRQRGHPGDATLCAGVPVTATSLPGASCAATRGGCRRPVQPPAPLYWGNKVPTKVLRNRTIKSSCPWGGRVHRSVAASQMKISDCRKQFCLKLMHPEHK